MAAFRNIERNAADVANLVERRVLANFRHRDFRQDGIVGEGRGPHIVIELSAIE